MPMLKEGDVAPDFDCLTHSGDKLRLSALRGKRVLLWFYPKADTPGCTLEGKGLCELSEQFLNYGVQILGVSFDTPEENRAFAEKYEFDYPLLCDTHREIGLAYGACDEVGAKNAQRIAYLIGKDGKIQKAFPKVNPQSFPSEALAVVAL